MASFSSSSKAASISKRKASAALQKDFSKQLKDLCRAGKELAKTFANLGRHTNSKERVEAYDSHREETKNHIQKLDKVIELLGKKTAVKLGERSAHFASEITLAKGAFDEDKNALNLHSQKPGQLEMTAYSSVKAVTGVLNMKESFGLIEEERV
ncbi:ferritin-like domain-containing protein [soil metagenome]